MTDSWDASADLGGGLTVDLYLAKRTGPCEYRDAGIVVTKRLTQDIPGVLAQQRSRDGIDRWRKLHIEWRLDVRHRAGGRMGYLADTVSLARFGCVKALLDRSKVANRNIGVFHFGHPALELVTGKNAGNNRAQRFLVGRAVPAIGESGIADQVRTLEHFGNQSAIETVVGTGHVKRSVGRFIDADGGRTIRRISKAAR